MLLSAIGWRGGKNRARGMPSRAVPARSLRASIAVVLLVLPQLAGCYRYVPVSSPATPVGADISVGITDRGRVALSTGMGPGVRRISGRVLESTDTALVLSVASVQYLDTNVPGRWTGERVVIARDYVSDIGERRLSRARSGIMAALLLVAVIAASLIAIEGFGDDSGSDRTGGGEPGQQ